MRIIALFGNVRFNEQKKELGGIPGNAAKAQGARCRGLSHEWGRPDGRTFVEARGLAPRPSSGIRKKYQCLAWNLQRPIRLEKRAD